MNRPMQLKLSTSALALSVGLGVSTPAFAQEVVYADGAAPVVGSANQVEDVFQSQTSDVEAIIANGSVTSNVSLGSAATSVTTDANTASASVTSNTATTSLDIGLVSGTGAKTNWPVIL